METIGQQAARLQTEWDTNPRWNDTARTFSAEDVVRLRGSIQEEYPLARRGAERLASVYSSWTEPRRRTTSSAEYDRAVSFQRGLVSHSFCSLAACWPIVSTVCLPQVRGLRVSP